jgi:hypothetical protein
MEASINVKCEHCPVSYIFGIIGLFEPEEPAGEEPLKLFSSPCKRTPFLDKFEDRPTHNSTSEKY